MTKPHPSHIGALWVTLRFVLLVFLLEVLFQRG